MDVRKWTSLGRPQDVGNIANDGRPIGTEIRRLEDVHTRTDGRRPYEVLGRHPSDVQ